ncbi:MAG: DoxX family protein [Muribaculaceae bacterium]|nr:DoxX family protein [Muribaculaceae bacterium]
MQFSASSASQKTNKKDNIIHPKRWFGIKPLVFCLRLILGVVFIFSGFVKAVDPWGGLYKITDYFQAWGTTISHEMALTLACALASFEFILGVMTLLGCYRKATRWLVLLFMSFMTVLTLYIWIADPVSDCGCFGDAFILSNSATFWKNIVLLALSGVYFRYNNLLSGIIMPRIQWFALVITAAFIFAIEIYGYQVQPMIDFRPFPKGTDVSKYVDSADEAEMFYIYERDGIRQRFSINDLPDESWKFVERVNVTGDNSEQPTIAVFDEQDDDVTSFIFEEDGNQCMLLVSDIKRYGISRSEMIDRLYDYCENNDIDMFAIIAGNADSCRRWAEDIGVEFPVYYAEDTDIKMIARGDASLVMIKDGKIAWKTNIFALPPDFPENRDAVASDSWIVNPKRPLFTCFLFWIIGLFACVAVSLRFNRTEKAQPEGLRSIERRKENE